MTTVEVTLPDELLELLGQSRLASRPLAAQLRWALAIHLFQEGIISVGRAAALVDEPRANFELSLAEMGIPVARWDTEEYRKDAEAIERVLRP